MILSRILFSGAVLLAAISSTFAGEKMSLTVSSASNSFTDSAPITLAQGESLELLFSNTVSSGLYLVATIGGKDLAVPTMVSGPNGNMTNPVKIAGPATVKVRIGPFTPVQTGMVTLDITRVGLVSAATAIPLETGATYRVILESSTDMVNWTPVNPGQYAADGPQRFFRTRMVRQ